MSASKNYYYKLFRVKKSDGKISTVSMDPVLVTKACQVMGGLNNVTDFVKSTTTKYNTEVGLNCSAFIAKELKDELKRRLSLRDTAKSSV